MDFIKNASGVITYNGVYNALGESKVGKEFQKSIIDTYNLCVDVGINEGLDSEIKENLSNLSNILGLIVFGSLPIGGKLVSKIPKINDLNTIVSLIMGPIIEGIDFLTDREEGKREVERFIEQTQYNMDNKKNINKNDDEYIKGILINKHAIEHVPKEVTSKNETNLKYIIANGETKNIIRAGNKDNYIRAIGGNNNELYGEGGNNIIHGYKNSDKIVGGNYDDIIYGGEGDDMITSGSGQDTLIGGAGNDYLSGSLGSDTYIFRRGDGQDKIYDYNHNKDNTDIDKIVFKDINRDDVLITKENESDITLKIKESEDKITIQSAHSKPYYGVEEIHFANGEILTYEDIMFEKFKYETDDKNNNITTYSTDDEIYGLGGDDKINAADGNNYVDGGEGDDMITSGSGQDILIGGKGNDYLEGRLGSDTYIFSRGDGQDKIYDYDTNIQNKDMVQIGYDFLNTIFKRDGSNLTIGFTDSNDSITINNWYNGSSYQIEEIQSSDNHTITNIQLQLMIDAMASYTSQKGIDWNTAIKENPNEIQSILQNFWVTKTN